MDTTTAKTISLLQFLKQASRVRSKRFAKYENNTKILWLGDLPKDLPKSWKNACRSAFTEEDPEAVAELWLEIRKIGKPPFPPPPEQLRDWVSREFQDYPEKFVHKAFDELIALLNQQITVLRPVGGEEVAEKLTLGDFPHIEDAWLEYLETQWKPWASDMRGWLQIQGLYEEVDFMRRRIQEAGERYELVLALGLLEWLDPKGIPVERHLLVAPAEITLDASRGVLTVGPSASFEKFRIELDMLEVQDRPKLEESEASKLETLLEELDVRGWDREKVGEILRVIANTTSASALVNENAWKPSHHAEKTFRVSYAPALVLRERRPTSYEELLGSFLERFEKEGSPFSVTAPWARFISEGETPAHFNNEDLEEPEGRLYFPLPTNEEQRRIAERLRARPYVLVKGPPGTGKSHTIANLITHLLAQGERVLVTAHAPKALTVLRDLLPPEIRSLCVPTWGLRGRINVSWKRACAGSLLRRMNGKGRSGPESKSTT